MLPGRLPWETLWWFFAVSVLVYCLMFWDKLSAQNGWRRVSEGTLLFWAFVGGGIGGKIAQRAFRHKTRKEPFRTYLNRSLVINALILGALLFSPHVISEIEFLQQK